MKRVIIVTSGTALAMVAAFWLTLASVVLGEAYAHIPQLLGYADRAR